jgi:KamA family protein
MSKAFETRRLRTVEPRRFRVFTHHQLEQIPQLAALPQETRMAMRVVASVLPFRVNEYVIEDLIDWRRVPDDPIFQLVFPQRGMLEPEAYARMEALLRRAAGREEVRALATELRGDLNPHPAGQMELNVPTLDDEPVDGLQHKYRETVLFFPSQGQVCHSYCTFCFRWAQFIGDKDLRFALGEAQKLHRYLSGHRELTDLLVTGGDPMVMKTHHLEGYLSALTQPEFEHLQTIRIGTKALTFWPYRFVSDDDSDDLLRLLESLVKAGKHVAIMAHYNHWRELETPIAREAIRRVRDTGAVIRSQGPLLRHINDDADAWARMWRTQVRLGIVPYYMFVERDTGAKRYFEVPLVRAWQIYRDAMQQVSGLGARHAGRR